MARTKLIPRGVTVVEWKNQDGAVQQRYRVRINRSDFKANKLFDDLNEAKLFLHNSKTQDGILGLTEREAALKAVGEAFVETLSNQRLKVYIDKYYKKYVMLNKEERANSDETMRRSERTNFLRLETIRNTLVEVKPLVVKNVGGFMNLNSQLNKFLKSKASQYKPLGDLLLAEITISVCNSYIEERLKAVSPSTVKREVGQIQSIFNKLVHLDENAPDKLHNKKNPWELCDKSKLKEAPKRYRRLSEEEEDAMLKVLTEKKNKECLQIALLALSTGMRRSEVLYLKWSQIHAKYIDLSRTKTDPRLVPLSDDTRAIIATIEQKNKDRLFKYTTDGFKTVFFRAIKSVGIEDLRFHDLRREHISRMIEVLANPNALVISELTGMRSTNHIESAYIEPLKARLAAEKGGFDNISDVMRAVGHKKQSTTQIYTSLVAANKTKTT